MNGGGMVAEEMDLNDSNRNKKDKGKKSIKQILEIDN
jgi:hypothetical protein